jgi:hypothetical protein
VDALMDHLVLGYFGCESRSAILLEESTVSGVN